MPAAVITLLIDQGEDFTYPFTWETGSPAAPVDLTNWTAVAVFWDVNGVVVALTNALTSDGQVQLIGGANKSPNVIVHLTDEGTAQMDSSGEFHVWLEDPAQDAPWSIMRGQYKVATSEVLPS